MEDNKERNWAIFCARVFDERKLADIGSEHNLSRDRIRQIVISETRKLKKTVDINRKILEQISLFKSAYKDIRRFLEPEEVAEKCSNDAAGTPIDALESTTRLLNCLKNDGICFLEEIQEKTKTDMLRVPNLGAKSFKELEELMDRYGLKFKEE